MSLILVGVFFGASSSLVAQADDKPAATTDTSKPGEVKSTDGSIKDIDEEITNARLRSTLGSKSRWSVKSSFNYNGSSVQRPFAAIRPNYQASATEQALTSLNGQVGINYRITERDSLAFGTGVAMMDPLHGNIFRSSFDDPRKVSTSVDRYQISTPYLDYSRGYKSGGMQMVTDLQYSQFTDSDSINDAKAFGSLALTQTIMADFGKSSWSGGLQFAISANFFRSDKPSDYYVSQGGRQDDVDYGIYPFAEYTFNDTWSFRTVFGYFNFEHFNDHKDPSGSVEALTPYQSVGVGISVTRDIYLYPNVQFIPLDIRGDRTNVALSANINVF